MSYVPMHLGHVNMFVRDMDVSEKFYTDILGLQVMQRMPGFGVFMSANTNQSHEIACLQLGPDATPIQEKQIGLNHMAWGMETFEDLQAIYDRLQEKRIETSRVADHGISKGIYFKDPDGNGIEVFYELPKDQWPTGDQIFMQGKFPMTLKGEPVEAKA